MSLRDDILRDCSRLHAEKVVAWIGTDTERFARLIHLLLYDDHLVVQRAAWIFSVVAAADKRLIIPCIPQMIVRMQDEGIHDAVKRNVLYTLLEIPLPREVHGDIMDLCFDMLVNPDETIAIRCFSMTILAKYISNLPGY